MVTNRLVDSRNAVKYAQREGSLSQPRLKARLKIGPWAGTAKHSYERNRQPNISAIRKKQMTTSL